MTVAVSGHPYEVTIGSGLLGMADRHLPDFPGATTAFVVSDRRASERWLDPLARALHGRGLASVPLTVPPGEDAKSLRCYETLLRQLAGQEAHRDDVVVALGGGAVGDLAGFVASTYMRGLPFVQVPTTLTAQVDASIGGKSGVNLPEGKNLVGTFAQPRAVLADIDTLTTLDERSFRSGLVEVVKMALTSGGELLQLLEGAPVPVVERDRAALERMVALAVSIKAAAVAEDERDTGVRLVLNYGHTLGHAIERLDAYAGRTHGEAVAIGLLFAARLAEGRGLAPGLTERTADLLSSLGVDAAGDLPPIEELLRSLRLDKKYRAGVRFVLLEEVGRPAVVDDVADDEIRSVLKEMGAAA